MQHKFDCPHCGEEIRPTSRRVYDYSSEQLSPREAEVCFHTIKGLSNKEISEKLFISEKTIKYHVTAIFRKLAVKSRGQLISGWYEKTLNEHAIMYVFHFFPEIVKVEPVPPPQDEAPELPYAGV